MKCKINVLYVDDEENNLHSFTANFRKSFNLFLANSAKEGLEILEKNHIHVIISDQRMPEMTGINFLNKTKQLYPKCLRIMLSAFPEKGVMLDAINELNIFRWLDKPFVEKDIKIAIHDAYELYKQKEDGEILRDELVKINKEFKSILSEKHLMMKLVLAANQKLEE